MAPPGVILNGASANILTVKCFAPCRISRYCKRILHLRRNFRCALGDGMDGLSFKRGIVRLLVYYQQATSKPSLYFTCHRLGTRDDKRGGYQPFNLSTFQLFNLSTNQLNNHFTRTKLQFIRYPYCMSVKL